MTIEGLWRDVSDLGLKARQRFLPTSIDSIWASGIKSETDLRKLPERIGAKSGDPEIEERIIRLLLVPDVSELPFPVGEDRPRNYLDFTDWLDNLSGKYTVLAAKYVRAGIRKVEKKGDENSREALVQYNRMILKLLPNLPLKEAERLWKHFRIYDGEIEEHEPISDYVPLLMLFRDKNISETWKVRAATRMHEVMQKEKHGEMGPQRQYEGAAHCYGIILESLSSMESLPVSGGFLENEFKFIEKIRRSE